MPVLRREGELERMLQQPVDRCHDGVAVGDGKRLDNGERAAFKSRLASPPPEGRNIDIRFFNKRDLARGSA